MQQTFLSGLACISTGGFLIGGDRLRWILIPNLSARNLFSSGGSPEFSVVSGLSWMTSSARVGHEASANSDSSSRI